MFLKTTASVAVGSPDPEAPVTPASITLTSPPVPIYRA